KGSRHEIEGEAGLVAIVAEKAEDHRAVARMRQECSRGIAVGDGGIGSDDVAGGIWLDKITAVPAHIAIAQILPHIGDVADMKADRRELSLTGKVRERKCEGLAADAQGDHAVVVKNPT